MIAAKNQAGKHPAANSKEQEAHRVEPITYLGAEEEVEEEEDAATAEFVTGFTQRLIRRTYETYDHIKDDQ